MSTQAAPTPLLNTFRHHLRCPRIKEDFVIDVALPPEMPEAGGPLPVIYLTDGNLMFPMVTSTLRLLQYGNEMPPALLVGIGYKNEADVMALRSRDLTPSYDPRYYELARQEGTPVPEHIKSGGADAFLDFIEDEVKPFIQDNYPAGEDDETLLGDSLGGLFTLHTLFTRPRSFSRYVAGSPSIWWHDGTLFNTEAAYADRNKDLDTVLFISIGGLEQPAEGPGAWARMVNNMHDMADRIEARNYPSLRMIRHEFAGETHVSVIPATFSRGMRAVFDAP